MAAGPKGFRAIMVRVYEFLGSGGMEACQDIVSQEVMVGVTLIPHLVPGEGHL